jgi:hypothetical protein
VSARSGGYLAAVALLALTLGAGVLLAGTVGYRLAFLPAIGCLVAGGLAAAFGRRPSTVAVASVVGAAAGTLAVPACLVLLAALW